jgi:hypothetical protein
MRWPKHCVIAKWHFRQPTLLAKALWVNGLSISGGHISGIEAMRLTGCACAAHPSQSVAGAISLFQPVYHLMGDISHMASGCI